MEFSEFGGRVRRVLSGGSKVETTPPSQPDLNSLDDRTLRAQLVAKRAKDAGLDDRDPNSVSRSINGRRDISAAIDSALIDGRLTRQDMIKELTPPPPSELKK